MATTCFVIMPFDPELHYLYLYMKQHLEEKFDIQCERGDSKILTVPLLDKIKQYIQDADFLIADCSGRNPNVFYELGMAHVMDKPVVLITRDQINVVPSDIKSYEFIHYVLDDDHGFFQHLDLAVQGVLGEEYDTYYEATQQLFQAFRGDHPELNLAQEDKPSFVRNVTELTRSHSLPTLENKADLAKIMIPAMIVGQLDVDTALKLNAWIENRYR